MNLTSLNRVKNALGVVSTDSDAALSRLVSTASNRIAFYLRREDAIQYTTYTEYFNPTRGQTVFRLRAYPVASITSIYTDSTGLYTGSQALVTSTDYIIGADNKTVWFKSLSGINNPLLYPAGFVVYPKSLKIIYIGGIAADGVSSSWTKSSDTGGTLAVGNYIQGTTSGAVGKITARAAGTISYESIYGIFQASETITEYSALDNSISGGLGINNATGVTATLTANTALSLAETSPDLTEACDMYIRYLWRNKDTFGNISISRDGENRSSRSDMKTETSLTPEVREIVDTYRNRFIA